jgi:hypothetical protein
MGNTLSGNHDADWLVYDGNRQWGPYSTVQLIDLLRSGRVDWLWLLWREGMAKWMPAARLFTHPKLAADGQIRLRRFPAPKR